MSVRHVRGLALSQLLAGPKSASQVVDLMRAAGMSWPARNGYANPTYERVMSSFVAMEPEFVQRTPFQGPRGTTWRLTPAGERRAREAVAEEIQAVESAAAVTA